MKYKVRRYSNFKKRNILETYNPKKKIEFSKEQAVPLLIRLGHNFVGLGGLISFLVSSGLMIIRGIFSVGEKVKKFSLNKKIVEIRIKNK